jgi:hypothetical protein
MISRLIVDHYKWSRGIAACTRFESRVKLDGLNTTRKEENDHWMKGIAYVEI